MDLDGLAHLASVGAALAAFWAAWEAREAAKASRVAVEAQVVYAGITEYFQPTMADELQALRTWQEDHGGHFATAWLQEYMQKPPTDRSVKIFHAKRHVKQYFIRAERLQSNGLIELPALRAMAYMHGINIFFDIVKKLDIEQNPNVELGTYEKLLKLLGRYECPPPKV